MTEENKQEPPVIEMEAEKLPSTSVFAGEQSFIMAQRMAKAFAASDLVPTAYRNNVPNSMICLEMAARIGVSPLMVAQNLHVLDGKPSWSSTFLIAAINSCGRFKPLKFRVEDLGEVDIEIVYWEGPKGQRERKVRKQRIRDKKWTAYTHDRFGELLEGPPVTLSMAYREGWIDKPGSKWVSMQELMGTYRAAAFFSRVYASDLTMGMHTVDEVRDIVDVTPKQPDPSQKTKEVAGNERDSGKKPETKSRSDKSPTGEGHF